MDAKKLGLAMALVAGLGMSCAAQAAFTLTLDDLSAGGVEVSVTDNGAGDINAALGVIVFSGGLGASSSFTVNVTTGLSKPAFSDPPDFFDLDLNSINVASGSGTLVITLTDTDYQGSASLLMMDVGGTLTAPAGSTVKHEAFLNKGLAGEVAIDLGPFGPGAYAGTTSAPVSPSVIGPYSLTAMTTLSLTGAGSSSFDLTVSAVPEPTTLALLGLGLAGLGYSGRRAH